ncbi:SGNH/GDSL hydrolase family protein [Agromyces sp. MMS24-K17]|uniref:SGNH/GDSL hydrolase family protein n=1 Tax=Agromyces sp. MMS24-K17 TaxID=3372850 RepID=UPI003754C18A
MSSRTVRSTAEIMGAFLGLLLALTLIGCADVDASPNPSASVPQAASTPSQSVEPTSEHDLDALRNLPRSPRVLVIGDSFTEGYGASGPSATWANIAGESLGWRAVIDGVGGTGFTKPLATDGRTGMDFRSRIEQHAASGQTFDLIVLQGGLNDVQATRALEIANVNATIAIARRAWPDAAVIVFGPSSPPSSAAWRVHAAAIAEAAVDSGAVSIDPDGAEPWINTDNADRFALSDGLHLNDAGYLYLAARFVAAVELLIS